MTEHLDRFRIARAGIRHLGASKVATLQSYGIETAADISEYKILAIPGFGPVTSSRLVAWRKSLEARFNFDPNKQIPAGQIAIVENDFTRKRLLLEQNMQKGLRDLRACIATEERTRNELLIKQSKLAPSYGQALADARAAFIFV